MKKILVKNAIPGKTYTYISPIDREKRMVLVCSTAITEASPKPKLFRCQSGEVWVQILDGSGNPVGKKAKLNMVSELTEYESHPVRRWRGWAKKNATIMNDLLNVFEAAGCWVESQGKNGKELPHYHRIGFKGKTICVVYRNGLIGFHETPKGPLSAYKTFGIEDGGAKKEKYMLFKIWSSQVHELGQWDNLIADLKAYIGAKIVAA